MPAGGGRRRSVGFSYEGLTENACRPLSDFPELPNGDLMCQIGRGVMTDPVANDGCDHRYCRGCITEMLKSSRRCPVGACDCVIEFDSWLQPLPDVQRRVRDLVVFCKDKPKGCDWRGPLKSVEEHMRTCKRNLPITCDMCKEKIPREMMQQHITECPKMPAVCKWCECNLLAAELSHHLYYDCQRVPPEKRPRQPPQLPRSEAAAAPAAGDHAAHELQMRASPQTSILRRDSRQACGSPPPVALSGGTQSPNPDLSGLSLGRVDAGDHKAYRRQQGGARSGGGGGGVQSSPRRAGALNVALGQGDAASDSSGEAHSVGSGPPPSPKRASDLGICGTRRAPDSPALRSVALGRNASGVSPVPGLLLPEATASAGGRALNAEQWALLERARATRGNISPELLEALTRCLLELDERAQALERERRLMRKALKAAGSGAVKRSESDAEPVPRREGLDALIGSASNASGCEGIASLSCTPRGSPNTEGAEHNYQPVLVGGSPRSRGGRGSPPARGFSPVPGAARPPGH